VLEVKAQATDVAAASSIWRELKAISTSPKKKAIPAVGIYTRHEPSEVITGFGCGEFDA